MAKLMQRYTNKFFQKLNPNWQDAKRFEALVHVLQPTVNNHLLAFLDLVFQAAVISLN
jgi:hypothetical protein